MKVKIWKLEGTVQISKRVCGQQGVLVGGANGHIRSQSMQINRCFDGAGRFLGVLRQQSGDESGKQVAAAAFGHSGIAGCVDAQAAIGMGNEGARAFENQRNAVATGKIAGDTKPVGLDFGDSDSG